jgi:hypothetical protein
MRFKVLFSSAAVLAGMIFVGGCASIMDGTKQQVKVDSNPKGAEIYTAVMDDGTLSKLQKVGATPATVSLPRKDGVLVLKKEGYEDATVTPKKKMNGWVWGDIVLLSLLSTSIDTSTGASKEIDPHEFLVEMTPVAGK